MNKYRVLIIDDEADVRSVLQICLQQDFEVVSAVNGFDALEKLDRYQPDVICSDISMPVMDGLTATKLIRRHPDHAKTPICIISANTTAEFMKEAYSSGANFFISKPFEPQRVIKTIKSQIEKMGLDPRPKTYTMARLAEFEAQLAAQSSPQPDQSTAAAPPPPAPQAPAPARRRKSAARPAPEEPPPVPPGPQPRVLIVDDDETVVLNLCRILQKKYEIIPIVDPLEAMDKLVKWEPDIMILAMNMPQINGPQLVRMLQPNPRLRNIQVIFTHDQVTAGVSRSAEQFTSHPVIPKNDLYKVIEPALEALCSRPGFRIRPKRTTYNNVAEEFIQELEEMKKEKQRELQKLYSEQRFRDLRTFISRHFGQK
ncbi:MAG: hypothetical protein Kow0059_01560 [Candidatus Sumerlaeia bacterium]